MIDADLGGHVVKKRISLPDRSKRGNTRTLVGTNYEDRWFFLFGFGKNERDNIDVKELRALQATAEALLALKEKQIARAIEIGTLLEVNYDDQTQTEEPHTGGDA
ncbi:MAG TPA: type II toxin-antitoxin system RelE/ParE family toxin [Gammaproteobacteria bacterium]|nr:type II toxin-antitoxin system RelE/ParE family toxin [Gammaproteobacteria bacterium]